jgi:hypothetical protein
MPNDAAAALASPAQIRFPGLTILSAPTLCRDWLEFDTSRFESSLPSQPQWSLACRFRCSEECRHSRGLAVKGTVSGEEYRTSRTERREFRCQSLLDEFSISEFRNGTVQRPVAFPRRPVRSVGPPLSAQPRRHQGPRLFVHPLGAQWVLLRARRMAGEVAYGVAASERYLHQPASPA